MCPRYWTPQERPGRALPVWRGLDILRLSTQLTSMRQHRIACMNSAARRCASPILVVVFAGGVAACSGPADTSGKIRHEVEKQSNLAACAQGRIDDLLPLAIGTYVKEATPKPQRFLVSVGTDTALGDAGLRALQDKGPTYLFPADPAMQTNVRSQLHDKGDYTTMLVVKKGGAVNGPRASIDLVGHYVGGEEDGQRAARRTFTFACDSTGWRLAPGGAHST
jgi:hypothetical protein